MDRRVVGSVARVRAVLGGRPSPSYRPWPRDIGLLTLSPLATCQELEDDGIDTNDSAGDDGMFWMSFEDFRAHFVSIDVCAPYLFTPGSTLSISSDLKTRPTLEGLPGGDGREPTRCPPHALRTSTTLANICRPSPTLTDLLQPSPTLSNLRRPSPAFDPSHTPPHPTLGTCLPACAAPTPSARCGTRSASRAVTCPTSLQKGTR